MKIFLISQKKNSREIENFALAIIVHYYYYYPIYKKNYHHEILERYCHKTTQTETENE